MNLKKLATATNLKYFAAFCMFLDHIHEMFASVGAPHWLHMIGRVVFPIFLFLAADSFFYTRDRKKFMLRLYLGFAGMVILNSLAVSLFPTDRMMLANNAFGTFFMMGVYICVYEMIKKGILDKNVREVLKGLGLGILPILTFGIFFLYGPLFSALPFALARVLAILISLIPSVITVEGGFPLVLLGLAFYIFRQNRKIQILILVLFSALMFVLEPSTSVQWMMVFAAMPMALYNGQKGANSKYFFYIFYPVHILFLYILSVIMFG